MVAHEYIMMHVPVTELEITRSGLPPLVFWKVHKEHIDNGGEPLSIWLMVRSKASDFVFKRWFKLIHVSVYDDGNVYFIVHVNEPDGTPRSLHGRVNARTGKGGKFTLA